MRILYDSKKIEYKNPFGALKTNEKCTMSIKIPQNCNTKEVFLCFENDHTKKELRIAMAKDISCDGYDSFGAEFSLDEPGLYFYHFFIRTDESDFELFRYGYADTNIGEGELWQLTCYDEAFEVGDNFCGKVMYQIFPDRFFRETIQCKGDKLEPYWIHENTSDIPHFLPDDSGEVKNCDFFGGNLAGITSKLDYIKSLGVSIIYLNPIFMAYSNHRYDTCDYKRIDPLLGDESDFVKLCNEAHKRDIKIILDGVFSHTGSNSVYFDKNKIFSNGAYENPNSPYRSWYSFGSTDDEYGSWWGIETLPCVNELDENYLDFIIRDADSVIAHWLNLGADGYRLDVADELPDEFIKLLRNRVKEIKPESYVVGEVWEDASNKISYGVRRKYFSHAELDSVMNYVFKNAIIALCTGKMTCSDFEKEIMTIAENYPPCALHSLMNSLSTHDTARIITALSGEGEGFDKCDMAKFRLEKDARCKALQRFYVAAFLQFVLPGNACIYYGDEIGMEGFGDPFCRAYMDWDNANIAICDFFKELGKVKTEYEPLLKGDISFEKSDADVLRFSRISKKGRIDAVINFGYDEICIDSDNIIFGHNVDVKNNRTYIQRNGFALYEPRKSNFSRM